MLPFGPNVAGDPLGGLVRQATKPKKRGGGTVLLHSAQGQLPMLPTMPAQAESPMASSLLSSLPSWFPGGGQQQRHASPEDLQRALSRIVLGWRG